MTRRFTILVSALCVLTLSLWLHAGEFPDNWTWDDDAASRSAHAELEGKPMPKLELSSWANGEVKS